MSKKEKIGALIADVNEAARGFVEKTKDSAVQIMDQNSDGHFDVEDLQVIKGNIGNAIKDGSNSIKEFVEEKSNEKELAKLNPIFVEDLTDTNFHLSKFLRILDRPEKYKNSVVCEGSIGFIAKDKDLPYHNIFKDSINEFSEKTFIPNDKSDFYYVDPVDSDM